MEPIIFKATNFSFYKIRGLELEKIRQIKMQLCS